MICLSPFYDRINNGYIKGKDKNYKRQGKNETQNAGRTV